MTLDVEVVLSAEKVVGSGDVAVSGLLRVGVEDGGFRSLVFTVEPSGDVVGLKVPT